MPDTLNDLATQTLGKLITERGIYASTDEGWRGAFHSWFGRDTAITAALVMAAEELQHNEQFGRKAYHALIALSQWQGRADNPATGEELGKLPHEIHKSSSRNKESLERLQRFASLWYHDPTDHLLKSWDSNDSTPLWIITVARWHEATGTEYNAAVLAKLEAALRWCLNNLETFDGWAAFFGADQHQERQTTGFRNQSWKDNYGAYQYPDGSLMKHPIKDVFVNACVWAALRYGADVLSTRKADFAQQLRHTADSLKARFNDPSIGFLCTDTATGLHYFAEALDGDNQQSTAIAADVGMCLWASHGDECIIDPVYVPDVVERLMRRDMFTPQAGIRNYSSHTQSRLYNNGYHRGPNTYWPFVSGLISAGLAHFGYHTQAHKVAKALLAGVGHFNSCIELFIQTGPQQFEPWHHPTEPQESTANQAWTAAAVYYAAALLNTEA